MRHGATVTALVERTGLEKNVVENFLAELGNIVVEQVEAKEELSIDGLGKFYRQERAEREGRNPKTGEAMTIEASISIGFKIQNKVKDKINSK